MSRFLLLLPGVIAAGMNGLAQPPAIEPVLRAELAFARLADQKGIRTAFLTWLTEDARVFIPRMTGAKEHYGREPGDSGQLAWYPEAMGLSASGDLAWSFGPRTYAAKKGEPVLVHQKTLAADHLGLGWEPALIRVAAEGDLAWTCGETGPDDLGTTASFLRIWILEAGSWKVLFDVRLPIPKPTS